MFSNIFSLGDVCLTRAFEEKAIVPIHIMSSVLAANIQTLFLDKEVSTNTLSEIPPLIPRIYTLNLGDDNGLFIWNDYVRRGKQNYLIKKFIEKLNMAALDGDSAKSKLANILIKVQYASLNSAFWLLSTKVTTCLPCNLQRSKKN